MTDRKRLSTNLCQLQFKLIQWTFTIINRFLKRTLEVYKFYYLIIKIPSFVDLLLQLKSLRHLLVSKWLLLEKKKKC